MHLCSAHLIEQVIGLTRQRIKSEDLIHPGDRVGIAFSGGKDSTVLLSILARIKDEFPFSLVALTIDEGISGYREETIRVAKTITGTLGIQLDILSFREYFGRDLDEIIRNSGKKPCTICGILRRRALEELAEGHHISVLATGHNLDDHAQTAVMNALSGDVKKVFTGTGFSPRFIRRVKPLDRVLEREIVLYGILTGIFHDLPECPYAGTAMRSEVRQMLSGLEQDHPGIMRNAAKGEEKLRKKLAGKYHMEELRSCRICGWPAVADVCPVCEMLGDWPGASGRT